MRVAVKNMSGVFIHSTTPRKARLLLKEKKAVIESNNPFTIRLLFSASECGLKDSKSLNKINSGLLPEKDITMFGNEDTNVSDTLNEFYVFILQSIRHILNSTDVDKVTWHTASEKEEFHYGRIPKSIRRRSSILWNYGLYNGFILYKG